MEVGALQAAARRHLTLRTAFPPRLYLVVCLVHNPIPPTSEAADGAWRAHPTSPAGPPSHPQRGLSAHMEGARQLPCWVGVSSKPLVPTQLGACHPVVTFQGLG